VKKPRLMKKLLPSLSTIKFYLTDDSKKAHFAENVELIGHATYIYLGFLMF